MDGTFYSNGVDTLFIYTQFFSTYSITYTTDPTFVPAPEKDDSQNTNSAPEAVLQNEVVVSPKTGEKSNHLKGFYVVAMAIGMYIMGFARTKKKEDN